MQKEEEGFQSSLLIFLVSILKWRKRIIELRNHLGLKNREHLDKHLGLFLLWCLRPKSVLQQCLVASSHKAQSDFRSLEWKDFGKFHTNEAQTYKSQKQLWCFIPLSFELTFVWNKKELYFPPTLGWDFFLSFEAIFFFAFRSGFGCLWFCERVLLLFLLCYLNPIENFSKFNPDKYICIIWKTLHINRNNLTLN